MKERTSLADRYLLEHFYQTCHTVNRESINCEGVRTEPDFSWYDVIIDGTRKCGKCKFLCDKQGIYYGKGEFSENFEDQKYVTLNNIRSQEELLSVCERIDPEVKGITVRGAASDGRVFERFKKLEFFFAERHRLNKLWDASSTPELRIVALYTNKYFSSLEGLENAKNLEFLQLMTAFSDTNTAKIDSLKPISGLPKLRELIISATEPKDHDLACLAELPSLEYFWVSSNLFPMECYAEFEAKKFMIAEEYGIFLQDGEDAFPFGKGKRVLHGEEQKRKYLEQYYKLIDYYKYH